MTPYHSKNGLFWERVADGGVKLMREPAPGAPWDVLAVFDPSEWASIVAHVSDRGESGATYEAVLDFHGVGDSSAHLRNLPPAQPHA